MKPSLSTSTIKKIVAADHHDPFSVLGMHSVSVEDEKGLAELQEDFGKLAEGLEWLSRAAWVNAVKNPSYATGRVHDALSHISDRVSTAKGAIDQLSDLVEEEDDDSDKEARSLARSISKEYRDLREDGILLGELTKKRRQIRDLEVGLVSQQSHPELEVSLKLLLDDQDEAFSRAYEHIDAMLNGLDVENIILFLDEPALGHAGFDYQSLWSPLLESFEVISGVHVCGNMNWDELFASEIEIISFDASQFDITKYPGYRNGKRIAWGASVKEDVKDFQEGDLITLPCGIGTKFHSIDDCDKSLNNLLEISKQCQV